MSFLSRILNSWKSTSSMKVENSSQKSSSWNWLLWPFRQVPSSTPRSSRRSSSESFSSPSPHHSRNAPVDLGKMENVTPTWSYETLSLTNEVERLVGIEEKSDAEVVQQSKSVLNSFLNWFNSEESKIENKGNNLQKESAFEESLALLESILKKTGNHSLLKKLEEWKRACHQYAFKLVIAKGDRTTFKEFPPLASHASTETREAIIKQEQTANRLETEVYNLRKTVEEKSKFFFKELLNDLEAVATLENPFTKERSSLVSVKPTEADSILDPPPALKPIAVSEEPVFINLVEKKNLVLIQPEQAVPDLSGETLLNNLPQDLFSNIAKKSYLTKLLYETQEQLNSVSQALNKPGFNPNFNEENAQRTAFENKKIEITNALALLEHKMEQEARKIKTSDDSEAEKPKYRLQEQPTLSIILQPKAPSFVPPENTNLAIGLVEESLDRYDNEQKFSGRLLLESLVQKFEKKYRAIYSEELKKQLLQQELNNVEKYSSSLVNSDKLAYVRREIKAARDFLT